MHVFARRARAGAFGRAGYIVLREKVDSMEIMVLDTIAESFQSTWQGVSSSLNRRRISSWASLLPKIAGYEEEFMALSSYDMRKRSLSLR